MMVILVLFRFLVLIWLCALFYTLFGIYYPTICPYNDIKTRFSDIYRNTCIEPLFSRNLNVDIELFVFKSPSIEDEVIRESIISFKRNPIWRKVAHPLTESLEHTLNVTCIDMQVRSGEQYIVGYFAISPTSAVSIDNIENIKGSQHQMQSSSRRGSKNNAAIIIPIKLTTRRNTPITIEQRQLLNTDTNENSNLNTNIDNSNTYYQYWKYGRKPIVIKYLDLEEKIFPSDILPSLALRLSTRYTRNTYFTNDTTGETLRINEDETIGHRNNIFTAAQRKYDPVFFIDDATLLKSQSFRIGREPPLNSRNSTPSPPFPGIPLTIRYTSITPIFYGYKKMISETLKILENNFFVNSENNNEIEELKFWLSDEYLERFLWTQLITLIHLTLEYLAFIDDWKFFVGRKGSVQGLSVSSILFNILKSLIIFLYLYDQETSWIILFSIAKDIAFNAYKVLQIIKISTKVHYYINNQYEDTADTDIKGSSTMSLTLPYVLKLEICLMSPTRLSAGEIQSLKYDKIAITHVFLALFPIAIGLAIYSLQHNSYKSYWSWLISSLADFVYLFGFISLTPQLYVNYRLKSVAHLPIKAFFYKIFNTFIDDIFAFIIKSPLKHKIMTLRDDLILLVFLVQWWIYPNDNKRVNEFGFKYD